MSHNQPSQASDYCCFFEVFYDLSLPQKLSLKAENSRDINISTLASAGRSRNSFQMFLLLIRGKLHQPGKTQVRTLIYLIWTGMVFFILTSLFSEKNLNDYQGFNMSVWSTSRLSERRVYSRCACFPPFNSASFVPDVDECETQENNCAHGCHNTLGSFVCVCNAAYELGADGKQCYSQSHVPLSFLSKPSIRMFDCLTRRTLSLVATRGRDWDGDREQLREQQRRLFAPLPALHQRTRLLL